MLKKSKPILTAWLNSNKFQDSKLPFVIFARFFNSLSGADPIPLKVCSVLLSKHLGL